MNTEQEQVIYSWVEKVSGYWYGKEQPNMARQEFINVSVRAIKQAFKSADTPPDVEQIAEALHACFFLMMQPGWFDCLNGEKKFTVFAVETFVEARAHAEKLYYEATKGYQAGQSASSQDATPQEDPQELTEEQESAFIDKLTEELKEHGIDTSDWEYKYGENAYTAAEYLANCIKGYAETGQSAVQDATPQEWETDFKKWKDGQFDEDDDYSQHHKYGADRAAKFFQSQLSTLRSELSAAQEENKRLRALGNSPIPTPPESGEQTKLSI